MILCIDSGNTRIKWGLHDGQAWLAQGNLGHAEVGELAALKGVWPAPAQVMLANVAGPLAAARIKEALAGWSNAVHEVVAESKRCGITNLYQVPERLGVDRWCALIGARSRLSSACLVVMAGTATTIDSLDAQGCFLGGMILPGIEAMRRVLAEGTAGLPLAAGAWTELPRNTDDAIVTGVVEAQLGAIERAYARLPGAGKTCLLSGGNAGQLAARLVIPHVVAENLPVEGLKQIALDGHKRT